MSAAGERSAAAEPRGAAHISGKLFLVPLVGLVSLTALALVAGAELSRERATIVDLYQARFKRYQHSSRLIGELTRVQAGVYQLMSWTSAGYDAKRTEELARDLDDRLRAARGRVAEALAAPLEPEERRLYEASQWQLGEYARTAHGVIELASADIGMANTYMTIAADRFATLGASLNSLLALEDRLSRDGYDHALERVQLTFAAFVALYAVALVLSILGSVFILQRMVISPIRSIEATARKVAEGDLTFDVAPRGGDELGRLIVLLRRAFQGLSAILRRIREQSGRISSVVEEVERDSHAVVAGAEVESTAIASISGSVRDLDGMAAAVAESTRSLASSAVETAAAVEQLVASVERIDGNIGALSEGVDATSSTVAGLARSVEEVATASGELAESSVATLSAVSEISRTVRDVEASARESAALSQRVTQEAETMGRASVERTADGMRRIQVAVEQTGAFVDALGRKLGDIGRILSVIEDVTDQTQLLSLNAAILAAQAGEHGRGFAIVANEIKGLAERTAHSTQEIGSFVATVQEDLVNVTAALGAGLRAVEEGRGLAGEAHAALLAIVESSRRSSAMAQLIERSTAEQALAARQVTVALEGVRDMSGHIASATAEQSRSAVAIQQTVERIADAARDVGRATQAQAATSRQVSRAMENVSQRSQHISTALEEHGRGSKRILSALEQVQGVPARNCALASSIRLRLRGLDDDAQRLAAELQRFRLQDEPRPPPGEPREAAIARPPARAAVAAGERVRAAR